jgi:hypothetical protein
MRQTEPIQIYRTRCQIPDLGDVLGAVSKLRAWLESREGDSVEQCGRKIFVSTRTPISDRDPHRIPSRLTADRTGVGRWLAVPASNAAGSLLG